MAQTRKHYSAELKLKVALEALKGEKTLNVITSEYGVHATQIKSWKQQALEAMEGAFTSKKKQKDKDPRNFNQRTSSSSRPGRCRDGLA